MKSFLILFISLLTISLNAQWVESELGGDQYGYNLYSSDSEVIAATLNGVYRTTDNGNPWFNIGLQDRLVFDVIKSGQYILAATEGTGPGVYRTSDSGNTWLEAVGIENQSVRAYAKNSSYVFACTWSGGVFRSSDDGGTWESVGETNAGFRCIYAVGETIFAGAGKVYFTTDNGDSWESRQLPYPASDTWCFYYTNGILYAGNFGLYTSTDMGDTWQLKYGVTFDNQGNAVDTKIIQDITSYQNVLVASVSFYSIKISYDGGDNWVDFNDGIMTDWTFMALAIKEPYIWALNNMGNAYYRPLTSLTEVKSNNLESPENYILNQNYPNPFNPTTKITYSVPVNSNVTLKVFDPLGNEIKTLVNEEEPGGTYSVTWNAVNLPSGIYFYQLKSGNFIQTKKMILLK